MKIKLVKGGKRKMPKVTISDACIGCGTCASVCEKTFEIKDGKSQVKKQPDKITCEKEAASMCPVDAIKVED